jgi:nucleoid DNA-binding protein
MKREDLARALAERKRLTQGEAQEELDRMLHAIVRSLRQGQAAEMPGIGRLTVGCPGRASRASSSRKAALTRADTPSGRSRR